MQEFVDNTHQSGRGEEVRVRQPVNFSARKGFSIGLIILLFIIMVLNFPLGTVGAGERGILLQFGAVQDKIFGEAGSEVVVEEFLRGEEASFFVFTDGKNFIPLQSCQDHKAAYDDDKGPNTGGMGAYCPAPIVNDKIRKKVIDSVVVPTINAMESEGRLYKGILYFGLMIKGEDIKVLEYNCRFGDPEAQPLLFRLKSDIVPIMDCIASGKLKQVELDWKPGYSVCVVREERGEKGKEEKEKERKGGD